MTGRDAFVLGAAVVLALLTTAAAGFTGGYWWASRRPRRPAAPTDDLAAALSSLELAAELCDFLTAAAALSERQLATLLDRQTRLAAAIGSLSAATAGRPKPGDLHWERQPLDPLTELPARAACEQNLGRLTQAAAATGRGGLLLVSLDRFDSLRGRFGDATAAELRRLVARLLCRTGRDADLACTLADDLFGVLLSDTDVAASIIQAAAVRDALRAHRFQPEADGPEVLVTASFGFTAAQPGDDPQSMQERAAMAVAHSRRLGRNRLHVADPASGRCFAVTCEGDAV